MCTQCVLDLQWFPSGRCYCRNRSNSPTDKGGPEEVCPSAEHMSNLKKQTDTPESEMILVMQGSV